MKMKTLIGITLLASSFAVTLPSYAFGGGASGIRPPYGYSRSDIDRHKLQNAEVANDIDIDLSNPANQKKLQDEWLREKKILSVIKENNKFYAASGMDAFCGSALGWTLARLVCIVHTAT